MENTFLEVTERPACEGFASLDYVENPTPPVCQAGFPLYDSLHPLYDSICPNGRAAFLVLGVKASTPPSAVFQGIVLVAKPEAKEGWSVLITALI